MGPAPATRTGVTLTLAPILAKVDSRLTKPAGPISSAHEAAAPGAAIPGRLRFLPRLGGDASGHTVFDASSEPLHTEAHMKAIDLYSLLEDFLEIFGIKIAARRQLQPAYAR